MEDTVINITSLILSPDFQTYVTHRNGAQLCCVDVYKLQYICSGTGIFMAGEVLAKKGTIYAWYYSYIISVLYNTFIYGSKLGRMTI